MKTLNKLFAIAAIAAASLFSAQTASAAVLDDGTTTTEATQEADVTFVMYFGSSWAYYDTLIADNPNRNEIVKLCVQMNAAKKAGTLTEELSAEIVAQLNALDCPGVIMLPVMFL